MDLDDLKKTWSNNYKTVPVSLDKIKDINLAATAFNANVDAVIKISGKKILEYVNKFKLSFNSLSNINNFKLDTPEDVIKGIFRCFSKGIGEEWLSESTEVYKWMVDNIGYDRLQMGGQGGIVANILGVAGVKKVFAHANSLPKLQAEQFLRLNNIVSFDEEGIEKPAYKINREADNPMIHWIIEFDKGDSFEVEGHEVVCPKSNRFIATYDPLNLRLAKDKNFIDKLKNTEADFIILSGFHALTSNNDGIKLVNEALPIIKSWKKKNTVLHLEIASTQDVEVRKTIVNEIAKISDSVGVNERETIDILEIIEKEELAQECEKNTNSVNLFKGLIEIKKYIKTPRVQLHMFGLYITIQDKSFRISPLANLRGMELAATIAASKAGTGSVNEEKNLLWAHGKDVSKVGLKELESLSEYIGKNELLETGTCSFEDFDVIAVPTIIIDKPKTLVGMGDTISSMSLIGAI